MCRGVYIHPPATWPLAKIKAEAREICETADPPVTFREALSVYRQLRRVFLVFRCKFDTLC